MLMLILNGLSNIIDVIWLSIVNNVCIGNAVYPPIIVIIIVSIFNIIIAIVITISIIVVVE